MIKAGIIILAAGKGTRMKSGLPKVMHEVAGLPMISHVVQAAEEAGAERVVVIIGPEMENVRKEVLRFFPEARFAVQEERLGTAHAARLAVPHFEGFSGKVAVLYGDTPLVTASTIRESFEGGEKLVAMTPASPMGYGRVIEQGGEVLEVVECRDANQQQKKITLCNSGVMAADAEAFFRLLPKIGNANAKGEYYLTDIVKLLREEGRKMRVVTAAADEMMGVNSRAELALAENAMQRRLRAAAMDGGATLTAPETVFFSYDTELGQDVTVRPNVFFGKGVRVGNGVEIRPFSHLEGAHVADGAVVGPFARLRPGAVIGAGAHIGNFVEVKKSVVGRGAKVNHLTYVGDAKIGAEANIGAGTITCNYDGFGKYETEVGEGAFIGSNTALVAPVKVGKGAIVGAGSVISEDVPDEALAISRPEQKTKLGWAKEFRKKRETGSS